ncbi:hypothetical protein L195_g012633 [Trifolium pratense]|uniref:Uncharacterized protein n=1 Tax=Trifolium pratense TaxID=57577 RepID=A0A2K3PKY5_TRIPR|nr:hypothetical protein L195_g012633 [Trifolium pratense]
MHETDSGVTIEYDPEPKRTLWKNLRAKKKREAMVAEPRRTMGDYWKRSDKEQISLGFQSADPVNFDIKGKILAVLRENQFDVRANRDPWDHLTQFSETCQIQKVPEMITEDQKKLRLFAFP